MNHDPISWGDESEIDGIKAAIRSSEIILASSMKRWMSSPHLEIRSYAFILLTEHAERCQEIPRDVKDAFFLGFLKTSIDLDQGDDYCFGTFDSLNALRNWIGRLNPNNSLDRSTLGLIKEMLEEFGAGNNARLKQQIVDSVLEHAFVNPAVQKFFRDWRDDPALVGVYNEASELAAKWRDEKRPQEPI